MAGFDRIWNKDLRTRAEELRALYGDQAVIIINYAFLGAANEMRDFITTYADQWQYCQRKSWPLPAATPEEHKENVRRRVAPIALDDAVAGYLFCPFMKELTMELVDSQEFDPDVVHDTMCYLTTGKRYHEFKKDEEFMGDLHLYLVRTGILRE